jgi:hypothetical protein
MRLVLKKSVPVGLVEARDAVVGVEAVGVIAGSL